MYVSHRWMASSHVCPHGMVLRWISTAIIWQCCAGKRVSGTVVIGNTSQWKYISKFGFGIGSGTYGMRFKRAQADFETGMNTALTVEVHFDEKWEEAMNVAPCERRHKAKRELGFELPMNGSWGPFVQGNVHQSVRPHVWYWALHDCGGALPQPTKLDYELYALQSGGVEFSVELIGTLTAAVIKLMLGTAFLVWFWQACRRVLKSKGSLHPVIKVLAAAAIAQYVAYACNWLHLWKYQRDGYGVGALDFLSEGCSMLSQILFTSLSLLLAQGYTILPNQKVSMDFFIPMMAAIVGVHISIVSVAKLEHDAMARFHENDGFWGWLLVMIRLALYIWFLVSIRRSYLAAPDKFLPFIRQLALASSLHYLAFPFVFLLASVFAQYLRHKVMVAGIFLMQSIVLGWYTKMFLTRGMYYEVSVVGGNLLPSPGGSRRNLLLFRRGDKGD